MEQTVEIEAEYGFDTATEIIMNLVEDGFSVEAESKNKRWYITAKKGSERVTIAGEDILLKNLKTPNERLR